MRQLLDSRKEPKPEKTEEAAPAEAGGATLKVETNEQGRPMLVVSTGGVTHQMELPHVHKLKVGRSFVLKRSSPRGGGAGGTSCARNVGVDTCRPAAPAPHSAENKENEDSESRNACVESGVSVLTPNVERAEGEHPAGCMN